MSDYLERFRRAMGEGIPEKPKEEVKEVKEIIEKLGSMVGKVAAEKFRDELMQAAVVALTHEEVTWFRNEPHARAGLFRISEDIPGGWAMILSVGTREDGHFAVIPLPLAMDFAKDEDTGCEELVPLVVLAKRHAKEVEDGE